MKIDFSSLNYYAIGLCLIISVFISMIWYSPILFGKQWAVLTGQSIGGPPNPVKLLIGVICNLIFVFSITVLIQVLGIQGIMSVFVFSVVVGVGILFAVNLPVYLYNGLKMKLLIIDMGGTMLSILIVSIVISIWK
jgi:hypothetical protein